MGSWDGLGSRTHWVGGLLKFWSVFWVCWSPAEQKERLDRYDERETSSCLV